MFLLVANGELALGLLVVLCKVVELLDGGARRDRGGEFDVGFCVFVAGLEGVSLGRLRGGCKYPTRDGFGSSHRL
jgi:hypothetical protein